MIDFGKIYNYFELVCCRLRVPAFVRQDEIGNLLRRTECWM